MFCVNCGSSIDDPRAVFCPECGAATDDSGGGGYDATPPAPTYASHHAPSPHHAPPPSYPQAPPPPTPMYQPHYPAPAGPGGSRMPKLPISKKMMALIGGGAAAVIIIIVLIVVLTGGNRLVGTWGDMDGGTWQYRMQFNRNGTGVAFELNMNTGMVRDEEQIRWSIDRIFGEEVLQIEFIDPFNPLWTDTERVFFEINRNVMGDDILTLRELDGWWTEHMRRIR